VVSAADPLRSLISVRKPILTYAIQLSGTASTSNIEILERFRSKVLPTIVDAPWYVLNTVIRNDLQTPTVKKKKSVTTALSTVRASVYNQTS
jgi:hypothetical protein